MPYVSAPPTDPNATPFHTQAKLQTNYQTKVEGVLKDFGVKQFEPRVIHELVEIQYDITKTLLTAVRV